MPRNIDVTNTTFQEKRAYWQAKIQEWDNGDLSQPDYCKEHNLSYSTFQYWRGLLKQQRPTEKIEFKPIAVKPSALIEETSTTPDLHLQIKTHDVTINIYRNSEPNLLPFNCDPVILATQRVVPDLIWPGK